MKFAAKNSDLIKGLQPVLACATVGAKREYADALKVTLEPTADGLLAYAHNGNVALKATEAAGKDYTFGDEGSVTVKAVELQNVLNSYSMGEKLYFSEDGGELTITPDSNNKKFQTLPSEVRQIELPAMAEKYGKEVTLKKSVFLSAASKVTYGVGFEKFQPQFLLWIMRFSENKIRSVSGDGSRFPMYQIEGEKLVDATKPLNILIHRDHNPVLEKVLPGLDCEDLVIKEYSNSGEANSLVNQTVISGGNVTMTLVGHNPGTKWPNEDKLAKRENTYKITIKVSDWKAEHKGNAATYNEDVKKQNQIHATIFEFNGEEKTVTARNSYSMKALRVFPLQDYVGPENTLTFRCLTDYITDMLKNADNDSFVQLEFVSPTEPLVVHYFAGEKVSNETLYSVNTTAGTKEQYSVFIAPFNRNV